MPTNLETEASDLLGMKPGTLRGAVMVGTVVYLGIFYAYNIYAQLRHIPLVTHIPYAAEAYGYVLYYLGLRTQVPNGSGIMAAFTRVFVRPNLTDTPATIPAEAKVIEVEAAPSEPVDVPVNVMPSATSATIENSVDLSVPAKPEVPEVTPEVPAEPQAPADEAAAMAEGVPDPAPTADDQAHLNAA